MTPKEKAEELVTRCRRCLPMNLTTVLDAKNCALIAVDEVLYATQNLYVTGTEAYWIEVKQEIEKL